MSRVIIHHSQVTDKIPKRKLRHWKEGGRKAVRKRHRVERQHEDGRKTIKARDAT